eukprot:m.1107194 g.1107194  ORF g.1107194 m.1107194 type:complete len:777 (-) comp24347_c0_seq4:286-2616(-)
MFIGPRMGVVECVWGGEDLGWLSFCVVSGTNDSPSLASGCNRTAELVCTDTQSITLHVPHQPLSCAATLSIGLNATHLFKPGLCENRAVLGIKSIPIDTVLFWYRYMAGASALWMSPAQRNSDSESGERHDPPARGKVGNGGFATPPRRKPRMSEDLSGPTPPPLSLSSLRESLKLPSFLSRPAKQFKPPPSVNAPAILEVVDEAATARSPETPDAACATDKGNSVDTDALEGTVPPTRLSAGASTRGARTGYHHLRIQTGIATDDTALAAGKESAPPTDGRRSKSLSAVDDVSDDDDAPSEEIGSIDNTDDVFFDEPLMCINDGDAARAAVTGQLDSQCDSPAPSTPRGHRMSTDIDTGKRVLTPLRRASRALGNTSDTPGRVAYQSPVPVSTTTPHKQPTSSAARRSSHSSTPAAGAVVRKRNSRAGLVTRQLGSAAVGVSTPPRTGSGRKKVSHRISSRGALLAMRRNNPLRETVIGTGHPAVAKTSTDADGGTGTRSATPQTPQIVVDGAVLFTLDQADARGSESSTDVDTAPVPASVPSDDAAESRLPPAARKQSGNHLVPLSVFSGAAGQRAASDGACDTGGGTSDDAPSSDATAQALRKLRSDGGTRAAVQLGSTGEDHVIHEQDQNAAARALVQGLPQSLDLAVSLPTTTFGAATTSSLPPHLMVAELTRALTRMNVDFHFATPHKIVCECRVLRDTGRNRTGGSAKMLASKLYRSDSTKEARELVSWEMEICLLPRLGMHGIRLRRICGDIWKYKQKVSQVTASMKL